MALNTVIFDIDGLLIDSEPVWNKAAEVTLQHYGIVLTPQQYASTTGLRTKEWIDWWFNYFNIDAAEKPNGEKMIVEWVLKHVENDAAIMPGVHYIINFFHERNFKIGLATSSPVSLIDIVLKMTGIGPYLHATASAEDLAYGKPHPQVYLDCAAKMNAIATDCLCFEDSFNGMLAAKSARMKCVVVPHPHQLKDEKWGAADLKLSSLQNFSDLHFRHIQF